MWWKVKAVLATLIDDLLLILLLTVIGVIVSGLAYNSQNPTQKIPTVGYYVLIAVGAVGVLARINKLYKTQAARHYIGELILEADRLYNENKDLSPEGVQEWYESVRQWRGRAEKVLGKYLDESFVIRFRLVADDLDNATVENNLVMQWVTLRDFLKEIPTR